MPGSLLSLPSGTCQGIIALVSILLSISFCELPVSNCCMAPSQPFPLCGFISNMLDSQKIGLADLRMPSSSRLGI